MERFYLKLLLASVPLTFISCFGPHRSTNTGSSNTSRNTITEIFDNNSNNWAIEDRSEDKTYLKADWSGGHSYVVENKINQGLATTIPCRFESGYKISALVTHLSGSANQPFGIIFGSGGESVGFNWFYITTLGYYAFSHSVNGRPEQIITWTASDLIKKGDRAINSLAVSNWGSNGLGLYINETYVATVPVQRNFGNGVGFKLEGIQSVEWSMLMVYKISGLF